MFCRHLLILISTALISLALTMGCTVDWEEGSQGVAQECGSDLHCMEGLACVERRCRPVAGHSSTDEPDAGHLDVPDTEPDVPPGVPDIPPAIDTPINQTCELDETRCASETVIERCVSVGSENQWQSRECGVGEICEFGECLRVECDEGEIFNPVTGECVTEEPDPLCCPDGCDDISICSLGECGCVDYEPSSCAFQNQPCNTEGQISNGFVCSEYGNPGDLRCYGLCTPNAADPDQTCPEPNSVCTFENPGDPNGLCLSECAVGDTCADDGMSCIYHGNSTKDGLCYPQTGNAMPGEPCDPDDFLGCADEAICVGGLCRQSCRPFDQPETDCANGNYCLALSPEIGTCIADTQTPDGSCTAEFTTCGSDATGCFPQPQTGVLTCYESCRLSLGDQDCGPQQNCFQHDPQNQDLGTCT